MHDHTRTLITIVRAFELLEHKRLSIVALIPVAKEEAFLDEIEAFTRLGLMLLTNVLWSITKLGFFQEVELRSLEESRITIVLVGVQQLHWLFVLRDS